MTESMRRWRQATPDNSSPHVTETWTTRTDDGRLYVATEVSRDIEPDGMWELAVYTANGGFIFGCDCSTLDDAKRLVGEWEDHQAGDRPAGKENTR